MGEPRYSIAVCNHNEGDTIRESLRSILGQITTEYEVVVVDDGSTDGSLGVLKELSREYPNLRYVVGENDNIAEARNHSYREARGEYVLTSLDTDDRYSTGIRDFVTVYHQLEAALEDPFHLQGQGVAIAPRELFLELPYRSMTYGEDLDRYRRLLANDAVVWLDHELFWEKIDFEARLTRTRKRYRTMTAEFRAGVTLRSSLRYYRAPDTPVSPLACLAAVPAYLLAAKRGRYDLPGAYRRKRTLFREVERRLATLPELEERHGFEMDRESLSPAGRRIFFEG